jgi:hypothetical protein
MFAKARMVCHAFSHASHRHRRRVVVLHVNARMRWSKRVAAAYLRIILKKSAPFAYGIQQI